MRNLVCFSSALAFLALVTSTKGEQPNEREEDPYCLRDGKKYKPGDYARNGCVKCLCMFSGSWSCQDDECSKGCIFEGKYFNNGEARKDDCNICTCIDTKWACTKRKCTKDMTGCTYKGKQYKQKESWKDDCNTCFCEGNNKVGCTIIACPPKPSPKVCTFNGKTYKDGESRTEECNKCTCKDGDFFCTLKDCQGCKYGGKDFEHGASRLQDCNVCYCVGNNKWACTAKLCPADLPGRADPHERDVTVKVEGYARFPSKSLPPNLPALACLTVTVEDVTRKDVPAVTLGTGKLQVSGKDLKSGRIRYAVQTKLPSPQAREISVTGTLSLRDCKSVRTIEDGDYLTTTVHNVNLFSRDQRAYRKDITLERFSKPASAISASASSPRASGRVIIPRGSMPRTLPSMMCMEVSVQDISLQDSDSIPLGSSKFAVDPTTILRGVVNYSFEMKRPSKSAREVSVSATLYLRDCRLVTKIEDGDFLSTTVHKLDLSKKDATEYKTDVSLERFSKPPSVHGVSGSSPRASGRVIIPRGSLPQTLPSMMCMEVSVQDISLQDSDSIPLGSSKFAVDPTTILRGVVNYSFEMKRPSKSAREVSVSATLYLRDCRLVTKIEDGDFLSTTVHKLDLSKRDATEYKTDVSLERFSKPSGVHGVSGSNPRASGRVIIPRGSLPKTLPSMMCMEVSVQDISAQDSDSIRLGSSKFAVDPTTALRGIVNYSFEMKRPSKSAREVSVSATLYLRDCRLVTKIEDGDFLSTTVHKLDLSKKDTTEYRKDIVIERYDISTGIKGCKDDKNRLWAVGQEFKMASNPCGTCKCIEDGKITCTGAACASVKCKNSFVPPGHCCPVCEGCVHAGQYYKPGDTRMEQCNTCFCVHGQNWGCTLMACHPGTTLFSVSTGNGEMGANPKGQCIHDGKTYMFRESRLADDGCNTCFCDGNDRWGCTIKLCPSPEPKAQDKLRVSGKVSLELKTLPLAMPGFSCLRVVVEDTTLRDAPAVVLGGGSFAIDWKMLSSGSFDYSVKTKRPDENARDVTVAATLYLRSCNVANELKPGDYLTTTAFSLDLSKKDTGQVQKDMALEVFRRAPKGQALNTKPVTFRGYVGYLPEVIKPGSCLLLDVREDIQCEDEFCNVPTVASSVKTVLKPTNGWSFFELKFDAVDPPRPYVLSAIFNDGWCGKGQSISLRNGDLHTPDATVITVKPERSLYDDVITMKTYFGPKKAPGKATFMVGGAIKFSSTDPIVVPTGSCLRINVKPEIQCGEDEICDNPSVGSVKLTDEQLADRNLRYEVSFTPVDGPPMYNVDATLNVGWCASDVDGAPAIRSGDHHTADAFLIQVEKGKLQYQQDLRLLRYTTSGMEEGEKNGKDPCDNMQCGEYGNCTIGEDGKPKCECPRLCPINYDPVCGSNNRTYANKCAFESDACRKNVSIQFKGPCEGTCTDPQTNREYDIGQEWKLPNDACVICRCGESKAISCVATVCALPDCPNPYKEEGECCMRCPDMKVKVSGTLGFNSMPDGERLAYPNCLTMTVTRDILCDDEIPCEIPTIKEVIKHNVTVRDMKTPFTLELKGIKPDRYRLSATVNNGWCQSHSASKGWIRKGDYMNEYGETITIFGNTRDVQVHIPLARYVHEKDVKLTGAIILNPKPDPMDLMIPNCLNVDVTKNIACEKGITCNIPSVAETLKRNVTIEDGKIRYSVTLKNVKPSIYRVGATLNVGWCQDDKDGDEWIRRGDYLTEVSNTFVLQKSRNDVMVDIKVNKYMQDGTACQKKYKEVLSRGILVDGVRVPLVGAYVPKCTPEGEYEQVQCHGSIGYCWCVHKSGLEMEDTRVRGTPECSEDRLTRCQKARRKVFASAPVMEDRPLIAPGRFIPKCNDDGSFASSQCHGSTGYCWCVDESGVEIENTRTRGPLSCDNMKPCLKRYREVYSTFEVVNGTRIPRVGAYVPQCTADGEFETKQCHGSTGYCWCVHKTGLEMENTRKRFDTNCSKDKLTSCQKERRAAYATAKVIDGKGLLRPGQYLPKCDSDGIYNPVQCHASTGYCWCVSKDGEEVRDTRTRGVPNCSKDIDVKLYGSVVLKPMPLNTLRKPNCLTISVRENVMCTVGLNCNIPSVAETVEKDVMINGGKVSYAIDIKGIKPARYVLSAVLNVGWCQEQSKNSEWIRYGDYFNEMSNTFAVKSNSREVEIDIEINKYMQDIAGCHKKRKEILDRGKIVDGEEIPLVGQYVPQCTAGGEYKEVQCHGSTGYCWCVHRSGLEVENTRRRGLPDCSDNTLTACQKQRREIMAMAPVNNGKPIIPPGSFIPKCHENGSFASTQCHGSTGYCWCVDEDGYEITNTRKRGKPNCDGGPCLGFNCGDFGRCKVLEDGKPKCLCPKGCPLNYEPVCGSNNRTYPNKCAYEVEACPSDFKLKIAKAGPCEGYCTETGTNKVYDVGQHWRSPSDPCVTCDCLRGGVVSCVATICASPNCPNAYRDEDSCCKVCPVELVTVKGEIAMEPAPDANVTKSPNCLLITVSDNIQCDERVECDIPVAGQITLKDIKIADGKIPYAIELKNIRPKSYRIGASLNIDWCQSGKRNDEWIRHGDYLNEFSYTFNILHETKEINKNLIITRYIPDPCVGLFCGDYGKCQKDALGMTAVCECPKACPLTYDPVCGSDGKTYPNGCSLEAVSCPKNFSITKEYHGGCPETVMLKGFLVLDAPDGERTLKKPNCARITVTENILCQEYNCEIPVVGETLISNVTLSGALIEYSVMLEDIKPSDYRVSAVVNDGWCQNVTDQNSEWIRYGDYINEYSHYVNIMGGKDEVEKNVTVNKYNKDVCWGHNCGKFGKCEEKNGVASCVCPKKCRLNYDPVCGSNGKTYANLCILESDACPKNFTITVRRKGPCDEFSNKGLRLSGFIKLSPSSMKDLMGKANCLSVRVTEDIQCESEISCDIPEAGSIRKHNVSVTQGQIPYSMNFKNLKPSRYTIHATLNVGWCPAKGSSEWLRRGDFLNEVSHAFEVEDGVTDYTKNVAVTRYEHGPCAGRSCGTFGTCKEVDDGKSVCVCPKACPLNYDPVCGSNNRTYSNLCLLETDACPLNFSIKVKKHGPCKENDVNLHGFIKLDPLPLPRRFLVSNCLSISVLEDVDCADDPDCGVPSIGSTMKENITVGNGMIPYKIVLKEAVSAPYAIRVILKPGICHFQGGDRGYEDGDYVSSQRYSFSVRPQMEEVEKNVTASIYDPNAPVKIGGYITLSPDIKGDTLEVPNCLTVTLTENIVCEELCDIPTVAEKKIHNVTVLDGKVPIVAFSFKLPRENMTGNGNYRISALLNIGWCYNGTIGKQWIRFGDYHNEYSYEITVPESSREVREDLTVNRYEKDSCVGHYCGKFGKCKEENKKPMCVCPRACPLNYDPVCGSNNRTYANLCVFESDACPLNFTLTVQRDGPCKDNDVKVHGNVILKPWPVERAMREVSCLTVSVSKDILCEEGINCKISYIKQNIQRNVMLKTGMVPYSLMLKELPPSRYVIHATVNVGWCRKESGDDWIKSGDFLNEYRHSFEIRESTVEVEKDVTVNLYENNGSQDVKLYGKVIFDRLPEEDFPQPVCLRMTVAENVLCSGEELCDLPTLATFHKNVKANVRNGISYEVDLQNAKFGEYRVSAVVNVGWCAELDGTEWIRSGDFLNEYAHTFTVKRGATYVNKTVTVNQYTYGKGITVSGSIRIPKELRPAILPSKACLSISVKDARRKDGTLPTLGQKSSNILFSDVATGIVQYSVDAKKPSQTTKVVVEASIYLRPCEGSDKVRNGDYVTTAVHSVDLSDKKRTFFRKDLDLQRYQRQQKDEITVSGMITIPDRQRPTMIPPMSCLFVSVSDTSRQDGDAIKIGHKRVSIRAADIRSGVVRYTLAASMPDESATEVTVDATIYLRPCEMAKKLMDGDYMTTTSEALDLNDRSRKSYKKDFEVERFTSIKPEDEITVSGMITIPDRQRPTMIPPMSCLFVSVSDTSRQDGDAIKIGHKRVSIRAADIRSGVVRYTLAASMPDESATEVTVDAAIYLRPCEMAKKLMDGDYMTTTSEALDLNDRSRKSYKKDFEVERFTSIKPGSFQSEMTVGGKVSYPLDSLPRRLPAKSCLRVIVSDTSRKDDSSITLGEQTFKIDSNQLSTGSLSYKLKSKIPDAAAVEVSVDATLFLRPCDSGYKLEDGDYITTQTFDLDLSDAGQTVFQKNVVLERFSKKPLGPLPNEMTVGGKVSYPRDSLPRGLPVKSCLRVIVSDTSRKDDSSITLGEQTFQIDSNQLARGSLSYKLKSKIPDAAAVEVSVDATVFLRSCDSGFKLEDGDYITTQTFDLDLSDPGQTVFQKNVVLERFEKMLPGDKITVSGMITIPSSQRPTVFPATSCLSISVSDTSLQDGDAIKIGHKKVSITAADIRSGVLKYSLFASVPLESATEVTVDATIYLRPCEMAKKLMDGDYMTTTSEALDLNDRSRRNYRKDFQVERFQATKPGSFQSEMTVGGRVSYPRDSLPRRLPAKSCLRVIVSDTSRKDDSSITLGEQTFQIDSNQLGRGSLSYKLKSKVPDAVAVEVSVDATVFLRPCDSGYKLEDGDYITTQTFDLDLSDPGQTVFQKNVVLERFSKKPLAKDIKLKGKVVFARSTIQKLIPREGCLHLSLEEISTGARQGIPLGVTRIPISTYALQSGEIMYSLKVERSRRRSVVATLRGILFLRDCDSASRLRDGDFYLQRTLKIDMSNENAVMKIRDTEMEKYGEYARAPAGKLKISGKVTLPANTTDAVLPDVACMRVTVKGTKPEDAEKVILRVKSFTVNLLENTDKGFRYNVTATRSDDPNTEISIAGRLYIRPCDMAGEIRKGDNITSEIFTLDVVPADEGTGDIKLDLYMKEKGMKVKGRITLSEGMLPMNLPNGACMLVIVEDTSLLSRDAVVLGTSTFEVSSKDITKGVFPYEVTTLRPDLPTDISVSGSLFLRSCKEESGIVKNGDFITKEKFLVHITDESSRVLDKDISLVRFGKGPKNACSGVVCPYHGRCTMSSDGTANCLCSPVCPLLFSPVCGSDGRTYTNECLMKYESCRQKKNITAARSGKCEAEIRVNGAIRFADTTPKKLPSQACLIIIIQDISILDAPSKVLGKEVIPLRNFDISEGAIEYQIQAEAPGKKANLVSVAAYLYMRPCDRVGTLRHGDYHTTTNFMLNLFNTTVGSYTRDVEMEMFDACNSVFCHDNAECHVLENGTAVCRCKLACPRLFKPVCGTDNKTYSNECVFKAEACEKKRNIKIDYQGYCAEKPCIDETGKKHGFQARWDHPKSPCSLCSCKAGGKISCKDEDCPRQWCSYAVLKKDKCCPVCPPLSSFCIDRLTGERKDVGQSWHSRNASNPCMVCQCVKGGITKCKTKTCPKLSCKNPVHLPSECCPICPTQTMCTDPNTGLSYMPGERISYKSRPCVHCVCDKSGALRCSSLACDMPFCWPLVYLEGSCCPTCMRHIRNRFKVKGDGIGEDKKEKVKTLHCVIKKEDGMFARMQRGDTWKSDACTVCTCSDTIVCRKLSTDECCPGCTEPRSCLTMTGRVILHGKDFRDPKKKCHMCSCKNGTINCIRKKCPSLDCPSQYKVVTDGECCPKCIASAKCVHPTKGSSHKAGSIVHVRDNSTACSTCHCQLDGRFNCKQQMCKKLDCYETMRIDSSCCPVCRTHVRCKHPETGVLYKAGETWENGLNGCLKCTCTARGMIECKQPKCPELFCEETTYLEGYCCPVCAERINRLPGPVTADSYVKVFRPAELKMKLISRSASCFDPEDNKVYAVGETWSRNCLRFECKQSGVVSKPVPCPVLTCDKEKRVRRSDECCSICSEDSVPSVLCNGASFDILVPKSILPRLKPDQLTLREPSCTAGHNKTHFIFKTRLDSCGTKMTATPTSIRYSNRVISLPKPGAVISRVIPVEIPVSCIYQRQRRLVLGASFRPRAAQIKTASSAANGQFSVLLRLIHGDGSVMDADEILEVDIGEEIFIQIDGKNLTENGVSVAADKCYVTPTEDPVNPLNHTLIQDGCAVDETVRFLPHSGPGQRFSFQSLMFTSAREAGFYLHCTTLTCDATDRNSLCATGCKRRRRRRIRSVAKPLSIPEAKVPVSLPVLFK